MTDTYSDRVAKGAALLDEVEPDWYNRVDVGYLEMSMPWMLDGYGDVLAQVFSQEQDHTDEGGYYIGMRALGLNINSDDTWQYGFDIQAPVFADGWGKTLLRGNYQVLTDAWRREVQARSKEQR